MPRVDRKANRARSARDQSARANTPSGTMTMRIAFSWTWYLRGGGSPAGRAVTFRPTLLPQVPGVRRPCRRTVVHPPWHVERTSPHGLARSTGRGRAGGGAGTEAGLPNAGPSGEPRFPLPPPPPPPRQLTRRRRRRACSTARRRGTGRAAACARGTGGRGAWPAGWLGPRLGVPRPAAAGRTRCPPGRR